MGVITKTFWKIYRTGNEKFPFHLVISQGNEILLDLYVQDRWPGTKGNIFCLSAMGKSFGGNEEEIECVPVSSYRLFGKRITVSLDRVTKKRCSFLFLEKEYKTKPGKYEQIFWQTQQGLTQRKLKYKLQYVKNKKITIFTDSAERYAWKFPLAESVVEKLPFGDYAIKDENGILAIIERKTFSNMVGELGRLTRFHQHLSELSTVKNAVLVIEANYSDFLDSSKMKPYFGNFGAKAIAEIQSMHPDLPIVFCGSRKAAIVWTYNFFMSVASINDDVSLEKLQKSVVKYSSKAKTVLAENEIRRVVFSEMPRNFKTVQMFGILPNIKKEEIRRILKKLENEGVLISKRVGRDVVWERSGE